MSHHNGEMSDGMRSALGMPSKASMEQYLGVFDEMRAKPQEVFGATGRFPDGKMHEEDEGEIQFGIAHDSDGRVHLNFGKPVEWIAMTPAEAHGIAVALERQAQQAQEANPDA